MRLRDPVGPNRALFHKIFISTTSRPALECAVLLTLETAEGASRRLAHGAAGGLNFWPLQRPTGLIREPWRAANPFP
jgi:hypothetical protein